MDKENHAKPCRHIIDLDLWKAPKTVDILDLPTLTRKRRSHLPGCVQNSYLSYFWTQRTPNNTIKFFEQHGLESLGFVKGCRAIYKKLILSSILFYVFHRYIGLCCSLGHTGDKSFDIHLWYQISYHTYPAKTTDIDSAHRRNIYNSALDKFDFLYIALGTSSHRQLTYDFSFFQDFSSVLDIPRAWNWNLMRCELLDMPMLLTYDLQWLMRSTNSSFSCGGTRSQCRNILWDKQILHWNPSTFGDITNIFLCRGSNVNNLIIYLESKGNMSVLF